VAGGGFLIIKQLCASAPFDNLTEFSGFETALPKELAATPG
jgi:hypothetical protein